MKALKTTIVLSLLLILSTTFAQKSSDKGANVIKDYMVAPFHKLDLSGVFNVVLIQGNENRVTIDAPQFIQDMIEVHENGTALKINYKKKFNLKKKHRISMKIVFTDLSALETSMVGNLKSKGTLKLKSLEFDNSCVGNTNLDIEVEKLSADFSAVGNITLTGTANDVEIESAIVGNFDASDLKAHYLDIDNSGVGSARVYASDELSIEHSGIGSLHYYGDAKITALSSSGIGKVKQH